MGTERAASGLRDNHFCGKVGDYLKPHLRHGSELSVVSAYFTIYAYDQLKDWLDQIGHMDFLFGEPKFVRSLDPSKSATKEFIIEQDGLRLVNALRQKKVAKECAAWKQLEPGRRARRKTRPLEFGHFELEDSGGPVVGLSYAAAAVTRF
jgi:hypothetical protein